jgi:hypothetical protein
MIDANKRIPLIIAGVAVVAFVAIVLLVLAGIL